MGKLRASLDIESYGETIRRVGDSDITSRRLLERILAVEEEHAEGLACLIQGLKSTQSG